MSKVKTTRNKIKNRIETIKKINDNPKQLSNISEEYITDIVGEQQFLGNKLDAYIDKRRKKKENKKDIFSELLDIGDSFLGGNRKNRASSAKNPASIDRLANKSKIKKYALESANETQKVQRQIIVKNVKKVLFAGDGICGGDVSITTDTLSVSPKEFDFLNVLTIDPSSNVGKIVYESENITTNKQKVNRQLYSTFLSGTYDYDTTNQKTLFSATWNAGNQEFDITGLTQSTTGVSVNEFLTDYYSSVEMPDLNEVVKNAVLLTIQGDGSDTFEFNKGQNELNRLLNKLFALCGSPNNRDSLENQNATDQFDENDEDADFYFDFDDVEGIDLDEEEARYKKVLRFVDCNNYEVPANKNLIEDFVYLSDKKTINEVVDRTFNRAATEAFEQSGGNIPLVNFQLSLMNNFILNLPKSLVSVIMTPKIFLPVTILYKIFNSLTSTFTDIKVILRSLKKLVIFIVKDLFWKFIREFWKRIKRDLLSFLQSIVITILREKYQRYLLIIQSILLRLRTIKIEGINNCGDLFNLILSTINSTLSSTIGPRLNIPGFILGLADQAPGYSKSRAYINITERMAASGVNTGPIFAAENKLLSVVKSMVDGNTEEMDTNGFVKAANKEVRVPTPVGPIIIPPGIINVAGKTF
jgi:hypothetical protein